MPVERVAELAGSEAFHLATREIRDRLIKTVERIGVTSERTLEQLHVFPTCDAFVAARQFQRRRWPTTRNTPSPRVQRRLQLHAGVHIAYHGAMPH